MKSGIHTKAFQLFIYFLALLTWPCGAQFCKIKVDSIGSYLGKNSWVLHYEKMNENNEEAIFVKVGENRTEYAIAACDSYRKSFVVLFDDSIKNTANNSELISQLNILKNSLSDKEGLRPSQGFLHLKSDDSEYFEGNYGDGNSFIAIGKLREILVYDSETGLEYREFEKSKEAVRKRKKS